MQTIAKIGRASLIEVAKRAGVSTSTASRALSRPDLVAIETRTRVLRASKDLDYQPNQLARGLRKRTSRVVGLLITDILNPFQATIAKGLQDAAFSHDYHLLLCNTDEDSAKEDIFIKALHAYQLQGLVLIPTERTSQNLQSVRDLPIVEIDRTSGQDGIHAILVENEQGARKAVEHLIELGHTRIATITGRPTVTTGAERLTGYLKAMADAHLPVESPWVVESDHSEAGGYTAALTLLRLPEAQRPTALFIFNNESTAGALRALKEHALHVPNDLSLVGFDDSRWAQLMTPSLTVVEQPSYEMGYLAGEHLFRLLKRPSDGSSTLRLKPKLIIRQSTAPPR